MAKLHAGSATRSDSLRSLVTLGSARLDLIQAQTDLATAEANLARLIGEVGRVQRGGRLELPPSPRAARYRGDSDRGREPLAADPERGRRAPSAARANVRASRSAYWPSLTLGANTGWNASRSNDYDFLNQRQVSLRLQLEPVQPVRPRARHRAAGGELRRGRGHRRGRAPGGRRRSSPPRLAELDAARSKIDITQTSVAAATEDLRVQQERYRLGASTIVDVLTSQEALNQAEVDVVNARFDYLRAKAQIEALIGRTL